MPPMPATPPRSSPRHENSMPGPRRCCVQLAELRPLADRIRSEIAEAMQERGVTLDGKRNALSPRFTVIATQNPIEQQGAYPLPEAQLDRFLFKHVLSYPSADEERRIVAEHGLGARVQDVGALGIKTVVSGEELGAAVE